MRKKVATRPDLRLATLAARQCGVVSTGQLLDAGLAASGISRRVEAGRLHRVHRGVYAVGHSSLSFEGRCMAAVLACGRSTHGEGVLGRWGAAVSHRSAAVLWGLLLVAGGPIDVTAPGDAGRARRNGIRLHRSQTLSSGHVTLRAGIPVTSPARTISDLRRVVVRRSAAVSAWELRRAVRQAEVLGLPLGEEAIADRTRSDLERDFLWLCRRYHLPAPDVNVRVGRHLVDFLWRERRLVVETDGYRYHRGRQAFEDDRDRDLDLRDLGHEVIHLSGRQIDEGPRRVAETLAAALRVGAGAR